MDIYEGGTGDPQSLHKYQYTHANPVNQWDPSGHYEIGEFYASSAASNTLAGIAAPSISGIAGGAPIGFTLGPVQTVIFKLIAGAIIGGHVAVLGVAAVKIISDIATGANAAEATRGILSPTESAVGQKTATPNRRCVIGQTQTPRVYAYAASVGAESLSITEWDPVLISSASINWLSNLAVSIAWIREKMALGYLIIDIGYDRRAFGSPTIYNDEVEEIEMANYPFRLRQMDEFTLGWAGSKK